MQILFLGADGLRQAIVLVCQTVLKIDDLVEQLMDFGVDFLQMLGQLFKILIAGILEENFAPLGVVGNVFHQIVDHGDILLDLSRLGF